MHSDDHAAFEDAEHLETRGAVARQPITQRSFVEILSDVVDVALYRHLSVQQDRRRVDQVYGDDASFWFDAFSRRQFQGMRIALQHFCISEWIPLSPGRFFTRRAKEERQTAKRYIERRSHEMIEYNPYGKSRMVLGGFGTLRLAAREIHSESVYLLGASSSATAHKGLVIGLRESDHHAVVRAIKEYGGCFANVEGSIQVLPAGRSAISPIQFEPHIPRHCVMVDRIEVLQPSPVLASAAIVFPISAGDQYEKGWSFCTFVTDRRETHLQAAVNWLQTYVERHSSYRDPPILNDFDEHYQHFDNPVEFPLRELMSGSISTSLLNYYSGHYPFVVNTRVINLEGARVTGDIFSNITGSTIFNRPVAVNSFNRVKESHGEDTAAALAQVAEIVNQSGNVKAAELFDGFNEELAKPEPRKSILNGLWTGLVAALPVLSNAVDLVDRISKMLT